MQKYNEKNRVSQIVTQTKSIITKRETVLQGITAIIKSAVRKIEDLEQSSIMRQSKVLEGTK